MYLDSRHSAIYRKRYETFPTLFSLIITVINMAELIAGYLLVRRGTDSVGKVSVFMLATGFVFCLLITAITSLIPMEFVSFGFVTLTGGLIGSVINVSSYLSSILSGAMFE